MTLDGRQPPEPSGSGVEFAPAARDHASIPAPGPTRLQTVAVVTDLTTLMAAYGTTLVIFERSGPSPLHPIIWVIALTGIWFLFALNQGAYARPVLTHTLQGPYVALKVTILAGAVFHLLPSIGGPTDSRITSLGMVILLAFAMALTRLVIALLAPRVGTSVDLVVVGAGWEGQVLADALSAHTYSGMRVRAFVDSNADLHGTFVCGRPVLGPDSLQDVVTRVGERPACVVLATADDGQHAAMYDQLTALAEAGIEVTSMAQVYELATGRIPVRHLGSFWWVSLPRPSSDVLYLLSKRVVDIAGALIGLTVLSLILPVIGPLLKRETRGSLFFRQERIGRYGRVFSIVKLRTLPLDRGSTVDHWERKSANRPSRVGRLVRKLGLDELPQCWNVLRGEMSLVGPRPYVPDEVTDFQRRIPFFRSRSLVVPGITGWAQVNWGYGFSLHDEIEKLQYDLYYVGNRSFYFDLLIMLRTIKVLVGRLRPAASPSTMPTPPLTSDLAPSVRIGAGGSS